MFGALCLFADFISDSNVHGFILFSATELLIKQSYNSKKLIISIQNLFVFHFLLKKLQNNMFNSKKIFQFLTLKIQQNDLERLVTKSLIIVQSATSPYLPKYAFSVSVKKNS